MSYRTKNSFEVEMQFKMNRIAAQCRQKCEAKQEKFTEKLEQLHAAYKKMGVGCQMMEQKTPRKVFWEIQVSLRRYFTAYFESIS